MQLKIKKIKGRLSMSTYILYGLIGFVFGDLVAYFMLNSDVQATTHTIDKLMDENRELKRKINEDNDS